MHAAHFIAISLGNKGLAQCSKLILSFLSCSFILFFSFSLLVSCIVIFCHLLTLTVILSVFYELCHVPTFYMNVVTEKRPSH